MANHQLHPLELNPLTNEPFLRLRNHKNMIITPPRPSDTPFRALVINDPRVHEWLVRPPVPHLLEHAEAWYATITPLSKGVLAELEAAKDKPELIMVDKCPVRVIREVLDNGEDIYLGDIGISRLTDGRILAPPGLEGNEEMISRYAAENAERPAGDPNIVWTFGFSLSPSHHGQGIMSAALKTILHDWAIPRMNTRIVSAGALRGNDASVRVFQKNGFRLVGLRENHLEARGIMRDLSVVEWHLEDDNTG